MYHTTKADSYLECRVIWIAPTRRGSANCVVCRAWSTKYGRPEDV